MLYYLKLMIFKKDMDWRILEKITHMKENLINSLLKKMDLIFMPMLIYNQNKDKSMKYLLNPNMRVKF